MLAFLIGIPIKNSTFTCQPPFTNPTVALEFVKSSADLDAFFGQDRREDNLRDMQASLNRDNFFVAGYTLFLMGMALTVWRRTRLNRYAGLIVLALVIGMADLLENSVLKTALGQLLKDAPVAEDAFVQLSKYTWIKWLGLAAYFGLLAPFLWRRRLVGRLLAICAVITVLLGAAAWFSDAWIQSYTTAVFGVFPLAVAFCFLYRKNKTGLKR